MKLKSNKKYLNPACTFVAQFCNIWYNVRQGIFYGSKPTYSYVLYTVKKFKNNFFCARTKNNLSCKLRMTFSTVFHLFKYM